CRTCTLYMSMTLMCFLVVITLTYCFTDGPINSVSFSLPAPRSLEGALSPNRVLSSGERLLQNLIYGPESFAMHSFSNAIYSGLKTGHIIEMQADQNTGLRISRWFHPRADRINISLCDGSYSMQPICGRPLGMRFHKLNPDLLLVADSYFGIYEIDVISGESKLILKGGTEINNSPDAVPLRHLNDLDVMDDGKVIFSEPSSKFADRDCLYAMTEHGGDGRLLSFDRNKQELQVLVDHLQYPNGVQIVDDGKCVLFAEMGNLRILRHCFGDGFSRYSIVVDNLPGYPDNIRLSRNGLLWVPLGEVRLEDDHWITTHGWFRDLIAKMTSIWSFSALVEWMSGKHGIVIVVDPNNGTIISSLHDPSGETISSISQVIDIDNGTLLLGGDSNAFVLRVQY
uniref:Strictosidine synthase conserved region domain-containing protein n=2 Tax=Parascaris univalens TaxID=6257 RepID=A0A915B5C5_PARUN